VILHFLFFVYIILDYIHMFFTMSKDSMVHFDRILYFLLNLTFLSPISDAILNIFIKLEPIISLFRFLFVKSMDAGSFNATENMLVIIV